MLSLSQPRLSVWNSLADYLYDPALELDSFGRQSNDILVCTLLGAMTHEGIRAITTIALVVLVDY